MTVVTVENSGIYGYWIDGYLPGEERMDEVRRSLAGGVGVPPFRRGDEGFVECLDYFREKEHALYAPSRCCEIYLLKADVAGLYDGVTRLLKESLPREDPRAEAYRHVVVINDKCACTPASSLSTLTRSGFDCRESYGDRQQFEWAVRALLDDMLEPFVSASSAAEGMIRRHGFSGYSFGSNVR